MPFEVGGNVRWKLNLAVEHDYKRAALTVHRLMTFRRKVKNREPPMPQRYAHLRVDPDAFVIRPAVQDGVGHATVDCL